VALGAGLGSCPVALPGHSGALLAARHVAPAGTCAAIAGCSAGPWDAPQTAAGSERLGQPRAAWSRRSPRPWELFGATPLHNRDACAVASQLGYKLFRGLRRYRIRSKNGEFPHIPPSRPCRRKGRVTSREESNWDGVRAAGEGDRLPTVTTCRLGQLCRATGGRAELLLPGDKSPRAHMATPGRRGHQTMTKPRDAGASLQRPKRAAGVHPSWPLRQVWGSVPAQHGAAGYARNAPDASGLDCGRSGRRASDESLGGLAAAWRGS